MIIRPADVHADVNKVRLAVVLTARALGVECDCKLSSMWQVAIDGNELAVFLET